MNEPRRCEWCQDDPVLIDYHDNEWGRPVHDDKMLFEWLTLSSAQSGSSLKEVLERRENYRNAFSGFDAMKVAMYRHEEVKTLLADTGLIQDNLKLKAIVSNARSIKAVTMEFGSFDTFLWKFVDGTPVVQPDVGRTHSPLSNKVSTELRMSGFRYVGSNICHTFLKAVGMINAHQAECDFADSPQL